MKKIILILLSGILMSGLTMATSNLFNPSDIPDGDGSALNFINAKHRLTIDTQFINQYLLIPLIILVFVMVITYIFIMRNKQYKYLTLGLGFLFASIIIAHFFYKRDISYITTLNPKIVFSILWGSWIDMGK